MTTSLPPSIAKDIAKPKKKDESEKALERATGTPDVADQGDYDPEADLAKTAEQNDDADNDLLTKTPLHGNTH